MEEKEIDQQDNGETVMDINADDSMPGTSHLTDPIEDDETEKLRSEVAEHKDKYLRLFAEFDNYKRRSAKSALSLYKLQVKMLSFHYLMFWMIAIVPKNNCRLQMTLYR